MNKDKCLELGINSEELYKQYENKYKEVFEKYILTKINLYGYDNIIRTSQFGFGDVGEKILLKSKLNEYWKLNHFYILNNFYIEKLNKDELDILINGTEEEIISMIEKTYKEIILANYLKGEYTDLKYKLNYTNRTDENAYSYNDELVIAIYYGQNKYKYGTKEKYLINYENQKNFLEDISNQLKQEFKNKLDLNVKIINEKI